MDLEPISLKPDDKNLLNKVTGIYQRLTGSSKGVESEVLDEPIAKTPKTPKTPKQEPTEAQYAAAAKASGMTVDEYKKAYRALQKK